MIALAYSDAILYPTEMKCPTKKEKIEYKGHITVFEKTIFAKMIKIQFPNAWCLQNFL